jgi:AcrR family transcriptional regulator
MTASASPSPSASPEQLVPDRRARRRQQTIDEILRLATAIMTEDGVNALSISGIARRLGVQPPSIYKYFPSLMAVYDELFALGQREHLEVMRAAMAEATPGLDALSKGLEASGRWVLENSALGQLMFWRPVPNFEPSEAAMAASVDMVSLQRRAVADAVAAGELGPDADSIEAVYLVSTLITGVLSQALANEPELEWGRGRFTPLFPKLMKLLVAAYPPASARTRKGSPRQPSR